MPESNPKLNETENDALKSCTACGQSISKNANMCPHCGENYVSHSKALGYFVTAVFGLFTITAFLGEGQIWWSTGLFMGIGAVFALPEVRIWLEKSFDIELETAATALILIFLFLLGVFTSPA